MTDQQWTAVCLDCNQSFWGATYDALTSDIGWHEGANPTHVVVEQTPTPWPK